jgi:hypothetical protein
MSSYFRAAQHQSFLRLRPQLHKSADDRGLRWIALLFAARDEHPFSAYHLYQSFIPAKSSLYPFSRPTLVVSVAHFPFAFSPTHTRLVDMPSAPARCFTPWVVLFIFAAMR